MARVLPFRPRFVDPIELHPAWVCLACESALCCPKQCAQSLAAVALYDRALGPEGSDRGVRFDRQV